MNIDKRFHLIARTKENKDVVLFEFDATVRVKNIHVDFYLYSFLWAATPSILSAFPLL